MSKDEKKTLLTEHLAKFRGWSRTQCAEPLSAKLHFRHRTHRVILPSL